MRTKLKVLIACEESQVECCAFRARGHIAFSCDIQPCRRGMHPEWHVQMDVRPLLKGDCSFKTMDGKRHQVKKWDLIIAHPPCTYLCKVSSPWMVHHGVVNQERFNKMIEAREFFLECLGACANYVAVENPIPMARAQLPRPSFYADPSWFGFKYTKKTLYWVKNLPPLMAEYVNPTSKSFVRSSRGKFRSRTYVGLADAIADQWGSFILLELNKKDPLNV